MKSQSDCSSSEKQKQEAEQRRADIRAEYLATRSTHPDWAKRMERNFPDVLADLINPENVDRIGPSGLPRLKA